MQAQKLEAVGVLANGVAHNFNNMLAIIQGYSDLLLQRTPPGDDRRRYIESIKNVVQRATTLTKQLYTFSEKPHADAAAVDLNRLVLDMNVLLGSVLGDKITLRVKPSTASVSATANPRDIQQVIMALVLNAQDAMPNGGEVRIEVENRDRSVLLNITDTGCGISVETRPHIFEPFFTTKGLANASGLGLSVVYGMIKQFGGDIRVASEPGAGTTFTIELPAVGAGERFATEEVHHGE